MRASSPDAVMLESIALHEGVIRRGLIDEFESFRSAEGLASTYYLNLAAESPDTGMGARIALKNAMAEERKRIDGLEVSHAVRQSLRHDWELIEALAPTVIGERHTAAIACFVASSSDYGRALRLPIQTRNRAFFEKQFVMWPLKLILDQASHYAICLTDKDEARLFFMYLKQIEEIVDALEKVSSRTKFPDSYEDSRLVHQRTHDDRRHFRITAEAALRLFQREPFEHLIIGGLEEILPQFESYLHSYLRSRVVASWPIEVHTPTSEILDRSVAEEQRLLDRQAAETWNEIQKYRPYRGALGPNEVFSAIWQRRVQTLLVKRGLPRKGFDCSVCGRLQSDEGACVECGGRTSEIPDLYEETVHQAIEQSAQVYEWNAPELNDVQSIAALKRF